MDQQTEYKPYALADGITYGPVKSRRLGWSLGVNILPFGVKVCSFNCSYCQCGWTTDTVDRRALEKYTFPTPEEIGLGLSQRLKELKAQGIPLDTITLAGNGEPTLHPQFAEAVAAVNWARDTEASSTTTDILSNGAHLDREDVIQGLNALDERYMKVDAGNESQYLDMNTPVTPVSLEEILTGYGRLRDFVAQSMFVQGRIDNTKDSDVDDWIRVIARTRPKSVQIYSLDRFPADLRLRRVSRDYLESIAARLTQATRIPAEVF